jgi:hypothetical protein
MHAYPRTVGLSTGWNSVPACALEPPDVRQQGRGWAGPGPNAQSSPGSNSPRGGQFYCELCRKQFGTAATLETHLGTKKHKAKVPLPPPALTMSFNR